MAASRSRGCQPSSLRARLESSETSGARWSGPWWSAWTAATRPCVPSPKARATRRPSSWRLTRSGAHPGGRAPSPAVDQPGHGVYDRLGVDRGPELVGEELQGPRGSQGPGDRLAGGGPRAVSAPDTRATRGSRRRGGPGAPPARPRAWCGCRRCSGRGGARSSEVRPISAEHEVGRQRDEAQPALPAGACQQPRQVLVHELGAAPAGSRRRPRGRAPRRGRRRRAAPRRAAGRSKRRP